MMIPGDRGTPGRFWRSHIPSQRLGRVPTSHVPRLVLMPPLHPQDGTEVIRRAGDRWLARGPLEYVPPAEVTVLERRRALALAENEGIYVRDIRTGKVRVLFLQIPWVLSAPKPTSVSLTLLSSVSRNLPQLIPVLPVSHIAASSTYRAHLGSPRAPHIPLDTPPRAPSNPFPLSVPQQSLPSAPKVPLPSAPTHLSSLSQCPPAHIIPSQFPQVPSKCSLHSPNPIPVPPDTSHSSS